MLHMRLFLVWLRFAFAVLIVSVLLNCAHTKSNVPESDTSSPEPGIGVTTTPVPDNNADHPRITLQWRTESEADNFGFNVYRADSRDGPFTRINKDIIPGAGTSGTPHEYTYTDFDVVRLKVYYYYLESVSFEGVKQKFSPIISQQVPPGKK